jgi:hypothetical protein
MPLYTYITKGGGNEALVVGELEGSAKGGLPDGTRKILRKKETEHYED